MIPQQQEGTEQHWQQVLQLLAHPSKAQQVPLTGRKTTWSEQLCCLQHEPLDMPEGTKLQQWLSFATDEQLGTFPLQRVLYALFMLLQGRTSSTHAAGGPTPDAHLATETAAGESEDAGCSEHARAAVASEGISQEAYDEQLARELAAVGDDDSLLTQKDLLIGSCIYLLLDVLPLQTAAIIARTPEYMEALKHQLTNLQYIDTGERFLLILCRLVDEQPLLSFLFGAAAALLPILDFFQLDIQRRAGACQIWRSIVTVFVCMHTAAAASAAAVAGLEFAAARAVDPTADGDECSTPLSAAPQQHAEGDEQWFAACQSAYAARMKLLASELTAAGAGAAVALQGLIANAVANSSSSSLAWQQQLMLQDGFYVLSVFAAYSDAVAAELLQQHTRSTAFHDAAKRLVQKQEMLLLEGIAAFGVSLLPSVRFQRPLLVQNVQHQPLPRKQVDEEAAAAADVLTVDESRAAVFFESPELLGRALQTMAAPLLPLLESSVTTHLCRFVLQLLLAAACTAASAQNKQQQLKDQLLQHIDLKTLGEICAHALHRKLPAAVGLSLAVCPAPAAAVAAAGAAARVSPKPYSAVQHAAASAACGLLLAATGAAAA
ncbi:ubiquitin-transferase domain-containing protein [Cyclospora cayetanensis]|uniref:Ubiquitin-transferase domain-containing protein n=1 Tax=Cyclospora cayetanensis TaxID=88456 RepID=A0A1D3D7I9_9EIME|nr:ubiquitin-transferase domain-containing protein [Cyclospora cayetanensis]